PCHGCIDNAIHTYAGVQLRNACDQLMQAQGHEEPTGQAKITPAYNLPCKNVIHTVGPIVGGRLTDEDCELLKSCYLSCLNEAVKNGLKSIAFCCISTGEFHFPNDTAAQIAVNTVKEYQKEHEIEVIFNVFKDYDYQIYRELLSAD
ncbi:MAG: macro domain-containing protein, partial [Ruminococcus sp.]|nr:macro domain-containing protein [Ruminococcus sp.]